MSANRVAPFAILRLTVLRGFVQGEDKRRLRQAISGRLTPRCLTFGMATTIKGKEEADRWGPNEGNWWQSDGWQDVEQDPGVEVKVYNPDGSIRQLLPSALEPHEGVNDWRMLTSTASPLVDSPLLSRSPSSMPLSSASQRDTPTPRSSPRRAQSSPGAQVEPASAAIQQWSISRLTREAKRGRDFSDPSDEEREEDDPHLGGFGGGCYKRSRL